MEGDGKLPDTPNDVLSLAAELIELLKQEDVVLDPIHDQIKNSRWPMDEAEL